MSTQELERVLGRFGGTEDGPLVITIAGLHGNEPAGVAASRRVLAALQRQAPRFRGQYLALSGNIPALCAGKRYVDEDLNRIWLPERIDRHAKTMRPRTHEERQQQELLAEIRKALHPANADVYFLDLHSTSAAGSAFSVFADTLHNRRLASLLPCPMVLGLEEHLRGTLLNYINELGYAAVGFEGGQNDAPATIDMHEAGIWQTLAAVGCIDARNIPGRETPRLADPRSRPLPRIVEIRYRHEIRAGEAFRMEPGFRNLDTVRRGDLLARDVHGEIRAVATGFILMPLYQTQGDDGFFLVGRIRPFWLAVSAWLRALRADELVRFLPGVTRRGKETLIVDPRIARWAIVQVFHLLGFRRQRPEGRMLVFTRRHETPVSDDGRRPA